MLTEMLQDARTTMAETAHRVFGNRKPALPLLAILERLEIEPFAISKVQEHKLAQLRDVFMKQTEMFQEMGYVDCTNLTNSGISETQFPFEAMFPREWWENRTYLRYRYFGRALGQARFIPFIFVLNWFRRPVGTVPNFVERKMMMITEAMPGVTFETDTLCGKEQEYDPFVIAKFGDEEYYFEVYGDDEHPFQRG